MASLHLNLLGGFEARLASGRLLRLPRAKARAVLAILSLRAGQPLARDKLASLLWPEFPEGHARHSLRQTLFTLRKAASALDLVSDADALAIPTTLVSVDATEFQRLVARATPDALAQACALYRGDLLEGFRVHEGPFEDWLLGERERLHQLAVDALRRLVEHYSSSGSTAEAIQTALRLVAIDPLQEVAHRLLMRAYAATGRRASAVRQYEVCKRLLRRELGVAPEPETSRLYEEIRASESRPRDSKNVRGASGGSVAGDGRPAAAPLVGRARERAALEGALDRAWQRQGTSVAVVGEAGVGKTRLVAALAEAARRRGARVLVGRAFEMEQGLSFGPWLDALRPVLVDEPRARPALDPVWQRELARFFPETGARRAVRPGDPEGHGPLFEAVVRLLEQLASIRPHVLLFEDLHWADETSIRLLSFVAHRIGGHRVLIVATAREEEVAEAPRLQTFLEALSHDVSCVRLHLAPLSRDLTNALTRSLVRLRDPARLAEMERRVWETSEGNPFVAVEAVRALEDDHAVYPPGPPPRVTEMIGHRLDRLDDNAAALVAAAAVIGREFDAEILQHATGLSAADTVSGIEQLVRRHLLAAQGERLDFVHDRVRAVALGRLLPLRRRLVHAQVAGAIAQAYRGDLSTHAGRLAMHYCQGQVWDRAFEFSILAGRQAAARTAHRAAVTHFDQALAALAHLPASREIDAQSIDLHFDLRRSLAVLAERDRVAACLREIERRATLLGDSRRLGWASCHVSREVLASGDLAGAGAHAERALAIATSVADPELATVASYRLAQRYLSAGHYRETRDHLVAVTRFAADPSRLDARQIGLYVVQARGWLGWALGELGEFDAGLEWCEEGIRIAEHWLDRDPYSLGWAYIGLAEVHRVKGDLTSAVDLLERVRALTDQYDMEDLKIAVTRTLGNAYALSGRLRHGLGLLRQAMSMLQSAGSRRQHATAFLEQLGRACLLDGKLGEARDLATRALAQARARGERGYEAYALWLLGDVAGHAERADVDGGEGCYRSAIALAGELGMRPLVARAHRGLGSLYQLAGRREAARSQLATARAMADEMGLVDLPGE